jgi:hypothetical protein
VNDCGTKIDRRISCSVRCHYCVRRISAGHRVYNKLVFEYSGNMYCCSMLRGPEEFLKSLPVNPWNFYSPSRHMTTSSMPIRPYTLCPGGGHAPTILFSGAKTTQSRRIENKDLLASYPDVASENPSTSCTCGITKPLAVALCEWRVQDKNLQKPSLTLGTGINSILQKNLNVNLSVWLLKEILLAGEILLLVLFVISGSIVLSDSVIVTSISWIRLSY